MIGERAHAAANLTNLRSGAFGVRLASSTSLVEKFE
jgi:hypothetical protein